MSTTNTNIQIKRSINSFNGTTLSNQSTTYDPELSFGEPFFIDNTLKDASGNVISGKVNDVESAAYLVLGRKPDPEGETVTVSKSPVIKAMSYERANKLVFYDDQNGSIINEAGDVLPVSQLTVNEFNADNIYKNPLNISKYYVLCQPEDQKTVYKFSFADLGIFIDNKGVIKGSAWNDYAEMRPIKGESKPGEVVCDNGNGEVELSSERLQVCPHVISDTYGKIIGEKKNSVPIAVAGRVLVYVDDIQSISLGDCVCANSNGHASKMTRQEIINYPDRVLGVVCEIPDYTSYNDIEINGRVWINVK